MKPFKSFLLESNYEDMFRAPELQPPPIKRNILPEIKWAKQLLKKQDRVTWYLKRYRIYLYNATGIEIPKKEESISDEWDDARSEGMDLHIVKRNLEHYYSLGIDKIDRVILNNQRITQLFDQFSLFEKEWGKDTARLIPDDAVGKGDKEIIKFPDGHSWWLLNRGSCSIEGEAMGHCGNRGSRDPHESILSLRQQIKRGSKIFYEPHLTFIVKDGWLGEMKGYANEKPTQKYHGHISKLLQDKSLIKGIRGGGYLPENNFEWKDLSSGEQSQILSRNPDFIWNIYEAKPETLLKHPELIKEIADGVLEVCSVIDSKDFTVKSDGTVVLEKFPDALKFIEFYGDADEAKFLKDWEENSFQDFPYPDDSDYKHFIDTLSTATEKKVREKYQLDDDVDLFDFCGENSELQESIRFAMDAGYQSGTHENYVKAIKSAIENILSPSSVKLVTDSTGEDVVKQGRYWDTCHAEMSLADFVKTAKEAREDSYNAQEYFYDSSKDRPSIDWDYDSEAATQYFEGNL